jgi:hypothetical protein
MEGRRRERRCDGMGRCGDGGFERGTALVSKHW